MPAVLKLNNVIFVNFSMMSLLILVESSFSSKDTRLVQTSMSSNSTSSAGRLLSKIIYIRTALQKHLSSSSILLKTYPRHSTSEGQQYQLDSLDPVLRNHLSSRTSLYNFDPLKPHFCIVKLGFAGVYTIFLISAQKDRLWVLVRTAWTKRF